MKSLVSAVRGRLVPALVVALAALLAGGCSLIDRLTQPSDLAIKRFSAQPQDVSPGELVTLTWDVEGADRVSIDGGVGEVDRKGSLQVHPSTTTTFHLTAVSGTDETQASIEVRVKGSPAAAPAPSPSPTPPPAVSPTPSPAPSATPRPTPTPNPGASPLPSPSPSPTPTPAPSPTSCGTPAVSVGGCTVSVSRPRALAGGECLELNWAAFDQPCPSGLNTVRTLRFDVTARTGLGNLRWRRSIASSDVLTPAEGLIASEGTTTVTLSDIVLGSSLTLEIVSEETPLLSFTLRHQ